MGSNPLWKAEDLPSSVSPQQIGEWQEQGYKPPSSGDICEEVGGEDFLSNGNLGNLTRVTIEGNRVYPTVVVGGSDSASVGHNPDDAEWWRAFQATDKFEFDPPQGAVVLDPHMKSCHARASKRGKASPRVYTYSTNRFLDTTKCEILGSRGTNEKLLMPGTKVAYLANGTGLAPGSQYCLVPRGRKGADELYQLIVNRADLSSVDTLVAFVRAHKDKFSQADVLIAGVNEAVKYEREDRQRAKESLEIGKSQAAWSIGLGVVGSLVGIGGLVATVIVFAKQMALMREQMALMREQMMGPQVSFDTAVTKLTEDLKARPREVDSIGEKYAKQFEETFPKPGLTSHAFRNGPTGGSKGWSIEYFFSKLLRGELPAWQNTPVDVWSVSGNSFKSSAGAFVNQESRLLNEIWNKALERAQGTGGEVFIVLREADALMGDGHMGPNTRFFKELLTFMEAKDNPRWAKVHVIIDTSRPQAILDLVPDMARRVTFIESKPPVVGEILEVVKSQHVKLQRYYPGVELTPEALEAIAYLGEDPTRGASPAAQVKLLEEMMKSAFIENARSGASPRVEVTKVLERVAAYHGTTPEGARQLLEARKADPLPANEAIRKTFYSNYTPVTATAVADSPEAAEARQFLSGQLEEQKEKISYASAELWLNDLFSDMPTGEREALVRDLAQVVAEEWRTTPEEVKKVFREATQRSGSSQRALQLRGVDQATVEAVIPREFVADFMKGPRPSAIKAALIAVSRSSLSTGELDGYVADAQKLWQGTPSGEQVDLLKGVKMKAGRFPFRFMERIREFWERAGKAFEFHPVGDWKKLDPVPVRGAL